MAWTRTDDTAAAFFSAAAGRNAAIVSAVMAAPAGALPNSIEGADTDAEKIAAVMSCMDCQDHTGRSMLAPLVSVIRNPFTPEIGGTPSAYQITLDQGPGNGAINVAVYVVRRQSNHHVVAIVKHNNHSWQSFGSTIEEAITNTFEMAARESDTVAALCAPDVIEPAILDLAA